MKDLHSAVESGRCAVAVSGSLMRDPDVVLALKDRGALNPMVLSGPPVSVVGEISERGVARAVAQPNGALLLVEPEMADGPGIAEIAKLLARATHKPKVFVVARNWNPFAFGALSGFKVEHIKGRGKAVLKELPVPTDLDAVEVDLPKANKPSKAAKEGAPRFIFVGRDEELAQLKGLLETGGPIVLSGSHGMGKRALFENAMVDSELQRFPDLVLGRGNGFDTLASRLAWIGKDNGAPQLFDALKNVESTPVQILDAATEMLGSVTSTGVFFIEGLHTALGRQSDFFRKSRLELLLELLLTTSTSLRLVFSSLDQPILYKEGAGQHLRRLELAGIRGKFLNEIFSAYKAPEFPRDRFGPIHDKTGGHPLAAQVYAIDVRDRPDGLKLTEDAKYMKLEDGSLDKVKRRLSKAIEKLPASERSALAAAAHILYPFDSTMLNSLGINRKTRIRLMSLGLLDTTGTDTDRKYRVHPLVRSQMTWRETSDFDVYAKIADSLFKGLNEMEDGLDKVVREQRFNAAASNSRQNKRRVRPVLPDMDHLIESTVGMIRGKRPHFPLAGTRLNEILESTPNNSDAWLMLLELAATEERAARQERRAQGKGKGKGKGKSKNDDAQDASQQDGGGSNRFLGAAEHALNVAPVPELYHKVADYWLGRRKRNKAIEVLEAAVAAMPLEARLFCRLGALMMREGRRNEAVEHFKHAMELQPMLPDAYGLLGMARRDEGGDSLTEAETLLREAVRLAPEDPVQTSRLADLLIAKAAAQTEGGTTTDAFMEAKELLEISLRGDRKAPEAQLLLAQLHRRAGGDLERAAWLLKQAKKNTDRNAERNHRIALEHALLSLATGNLDKAESLARDQTTRNGSSHRAFATLATILEARQQLIPAHAELMRAKERAPQGSLFETDYEQQLARLVTQIEANAAGLGQAAPTPVAAPAEPTAPSEATGSTANRTIRRAKASEAAPAADAAPTVAPEAAPEASPPAVTPAAAPQAPAVPPTDA